jgi:hypothetical protein
MSFDEPLSNKTLRESDQPGGNDAKVKIQSQGSRKMMNNLINELVADKIDQKKNFGLKEPQRKHMKSLTSLPDIKSSEPENRKKDFGIRKKEQTISLEQTGSTENLPQVSTTGIFSKKESQNITEERLSNSRFNLQRKTILTKEINNQPKKFEEDEKQTSSNKPNQQNEKINSSLPNASTSLTNEGITHKNDLTEAHLNKLCDLKIQQKLEEQIKTQTETDDFEKIEQEREKKMEGKCCGDSQCIIN